MEVLRKLHEKTKALEQCQKLNEQLQEALCTKIKKAGKLLHLVHSQINNHFEFQAPGIMFFKAFFVFTAMKGYNISFYVSTTYILFQCCFPTMVSLDCFQCQKGGAEETAPLYYVDFEGQGDANEPGLDPAWSSLSAMTVECNIRKVIWEIYVPNH